MTAVLALSLSSQIEKYGAYAGIAAIVGLGVLSLLYFAQAREVRRLREWAGRSPERDADLQQRVATYAERRTVPPAPRLEPARPAPAGPATPAAVAAAAAGTPAAGAVAGAHPGTPTGAKPPVPATAAAGVGAVTATGAPSPAGAAPAPPGAPGAGAPTPGTTAPASVPSPPSPQQPTAPAGAQVPPKPAAPIAAAAGATAAGVAATSSVPAAPVTPGQAPATPAAKPPVPPPPAAAAPPAGPAATPPTPPPTRPRPRPAAAPVRATRPEATLPPRDGARPPAETGSRRGLLAVIAGGLAIAVVAALLITQVFSGDDDPASTRPNSVGTPTTPAESGDGGTAAKPQPKRDTTQVAVFNGTTVTGLARAAADKLTAAGYKNVSPVTTDTTNQSRASTVVYWQSGSRREGVDAARLIGVSRAALVPMDQNARVLGGGAPVVVIVGADQAQ